MAYKYKSLERKWRDRWEDEGIFEADPERGKPKKFTTFPFPYMNGPLHLGHAFTSSRCDVYARFKRMQGYNVLFPWSWHLTGEPIAGAAERFRNGDESQIKIFRDIDKVPENDLKNFGNLEYLANYYIKDAKASLKKLGHSIDWRREFTTTSLHPSFDKFIEWQYLTLRKSGYVRKGTHPVIWCPHDQSPTGDHDRLKGEGASPLEFILIKFKYGDTFLPAATLRPETIFGVTNIWINPAATMVLAKIENEKWIVSREAIIKLKEQMDNIVIEKEFPGSEIVGKTCVHPLNNESMLILPATFVNPDNSSGVVMGVPSHAPFDHVALEDLKRNLKELQKYGISLREIQDIRPISLIRSPSYGENPAIEICSKMGITNQNDEKLEVATEEIYKNEFYKGVLRANTGKYKGIEVSKVKKILIKDLVETGIADILYETSEEVICRCSTKCIVKILKDQWFLEYSNDAWKKKVREALAKMEILPTEARANFEYTIGWLEDKACTRRTGLGTRLPWDKEWIVETLSDSTVYMAFYALSKFTNSHKIKSEELNTEVLDYLFLNIGKALDVSRKYNINVELLEEIREEIEYWMPVDLRVSGKDLIPNHLTFFIFQHTAIFSRGNWPKKISVNGYMRVEGEKMSKSKGNFITLKALLQEHGADVTRAALLYSAEGLRDPDWRTKSVQDMKTKQRAFRILLENLIINEGIKTDIRCIDNWILSRMQRHIHRTTLAYEKLETRTAFQYAFFDIWKDLRWYLRRGQPNKIVIMQVISQWLRLISPFIPFITEELWFQMKEKGFISLAPWPKVDKSRISEKSEVKEDLIKEISGDIENILEVIEKRPKKVYLYTSPKWKWDVLKIASKIKDQDQKGIIKEVLKYEELKVRMKEVIKYVSLVNKIPNLSKVIRIDEMETIEDAKSFLEKEFNCDIIVKNSDERGIYDPMKKGGQSIPLKPAIYVE